MGYSSKDVSAPGQHSNNLLLDPVFSALDSY